MRRIVFFSTLLVLLNSSCIVTKKKYDDLLAQKVRLEADLSDRTAQLDSANNELSSLRQAIDKLKQDTTHLGEDVRTTEKKLAGLENEYEQLNTYYRISNTGVANKTANWQGRVIIGKPSREANRALSNSVLTSRDADGPLKPVRRLQYEGSVLKLLRHAFAPCGR